MDTTLRFAYSNPDEIRTFRAYKRIDAAGGELELYQASVFSFTSLRRYSPAQVLPLHLRSLVRGDDVSAAGFDHVCVGAGGRNIVDVQLERDGAFWHGGGERDFLARVTF